MLRIVYRILFLLKVIETATIFILVENNKEGI